MNKVSSSIRKYRMSITEVTDEETNSSIVLYERDITSFSLKQMIYVINSLADPADINVKIMSLKTHVKELL